MAHHIWGDSPNAERNTKIVQMRMKGMSCREIGEEVGISTGRVHQIWKKWQKKKDNFLTEGKFDPDSETREIEEPVIEEPVVEEEKPSKNIISRYFDIFYRSITGR